MQIKYPSHVLWLCFYVLVFYTFVYLIKNYEKKWENKILIDETINQNSIFFLNYAAYVRI